MSDGEARRKRVDEENISTADLAEGRADSHMDRRARHARAEEVLDVQPEDQPIIPAKVQKAEVNAQAVPLNSVGDSVSEAAPAQGAPQASNESHPGPLFSPEEAANLRSKWDEIQVGFVDEPRHSVQEADSLVAATMKRLAEQFAAERSGLEGQWDRGSDVSTEDLRIALRRYRSFFGRLLSI